VIGLVFGSERITSALELKVVTLSLTIVFISVYVLFYIFDHLSIIMNLCEKDKSLKICTMGSLPIFILILLLISGGLIMVVNITAYLMISGTKRV